ncbi:Os06g0318400, partial [Oryza sativa Japonica Group]
RQVCPWLKGIQTVVSPSSSPTCSCWPGARFVTPRSLFNCGRSAPPPPEFQYHDVAPPFPMSLVANTHLRGRELRCYYKANVDGFSATDFHCHWPHGHRRCHRRGHVRWVQPTGVPKHGRLLRHARRLPLLLAGHGHGRRSDGGGGAAKGGRERATLFNYARAAVRRRWAAHWAAADRRDVDVHGARLQRRCR